MKRKLFVLLLLLGAAGTLGAQEVEILPSQPRLTANIVRQYKEDVSIHYCEDTAGNHYFLLHDYNDPSSVVKALFPTVYSVRDFEVMGDVVYFCGTFYNGGNPWGLVGLIGIQDLFYSNQPYTIGYVVQLLYGSEVTYCHLSSADRMDLYVDSKGKAHWAIVGVLEHNAEYGVEQRRTACDIMYDPTIATGQWRGEVLYQKDDLYSPTDITCTDEYVVVSAVNDDKSHSLLLVFDKLQYFVSHPSYPYSFRLMDRRSDNNVRVERMGRNDVAITHYYYDKNRREYGTAIHHLHDMSTMTPSSVTYQSLHILHGAAAPIDTIREVRYNTAEHLLSLLHDISDPVWGSAHSSIFEYDPYSGSSLLRVWYEPTWNAQLKSFDNRSYANLITVVGGNHLSFGNPLIGHKRQDSPCYSYDYIRSSNPAVQIKTMDFDKPVLTYNQNEWKFFAPNPTKIPIQNICQ